MSDKSDSGKNASDNSSWGFNYILPLVVLPCFVLAVLMSTVAAFERARADEIREEIYSQLEQVEGSRVCLLQDGSLAVMGNVDCTLGHGGTAFIIKRDGNGRVIDLIPNTPKP